MYEIFESLLRERGITSYRVAKDTGITSATLSDWKNGKSQPKVDKLQKIADYFGVSLDYLCGKEEETVQKEKAPGISSEGLTDSEREALAMWRTLSPEEQVAQMAVWKARANRK